MNENETERELKVIEIEQEAEVEATQNDGTLIRLIAAHFPLKTGKAS